MPRPRKCRKVCCLPDNPGFIPIKPRTPQGTVILNVDEYETIRLIDREGYSQEQCGNYMGVARTTVQQIYTSARRKIADALVSGLSLRIDGGDYQLCDGDDSACPCGGCWRRHLKNSGYKEITSMKIAIPLDENKKDVCVSFGRAPFFLFHDQTGDEILENPAANAQGGAGLKAAQFLVDHDVTILITVRCGQNAADVFQAVGMKIFKSQATDAQENITAYEENELAELTHFHAGFHGVG